MSRTTIYFSALALIVVLFGAAYWFLTAPLQQPPAAEVEVPDHFAVFLEHKACAGNCPVYAVLAKASGTVEYVGEKNVATTGSHKASLQREQLVALVHAVKNANFFSTPDIYHNGVGGRGCKSLKPGQAAIIIGVTRNADTKVIHYDYGCGGAPASLGKLADQIDQILRTDRWTAATT
ncbi:MAG TPA: DUF6438 domain-containing protein [Gammaproteobacteria bacterium]|jgi:hypothetical protein|nr:DUF6438 domain-containing protein [Gammaproteobacteria bacterium]